MKFSEQLKMKLGVYPELMLNQAQFEPTEWQKKFGEAFNTKKSFAISKAGRRVGATTMLQLIMKKIMIQQEGKYIGVLNPSKDDWINIGKIAKSSSVLQVSNSKIIAGKNWTIRRISTFNDIRGVNFDYFLADEYNYNEVNGLLSSVLQNLSLTRMIIVFSTSSPKTKEIRKSIKQLRLDLYEG